MTNHGLLMKFSVKPRGILPHLSVHCHSSVDWLVGCESGVELEVSLNRKWENYQQFNPAHNSTNFKVQLKVSGQLPVLDSLLTRKDRSWTSRFRYRKVPVNQSTNVYSPIVEFDKLPNFDIKEYLSTRGPTEWAYPKQQRSFEQQLSRKIWMMEIRKTRGLRDAREMDIY